MLDHVLQREARVMVSRVPTDTHPYLPLHRDGEEGEEVEQENRPEDRDIKDSEKGAEHCDQSGFGD